jgi:hypothetical protein
MLVETCVSQRCLLEGRNGSRAEIVEVLGCARGGEGTEGRQSPAALVLAVGALEAISAEQEKIAAFPPTQAPWSFPRSSRQCNPFCPTGAGLARGAFSFLFVCEGVCTRVHDQ